MANMTRPELLVAASPVLHAAGHRVASRKLLLDSVELLGLFNLDSPGLVFRFHSPDSEYYILVIQGTAGMICRRLDEIDWIHWAGNQLPSEINSGDNPGQYELYRRQAEIRDGQDHD